jgi:hypothetical protein
MPALSAPFGRGERQGAEVAQARTAADRWGMAFLLVIVGTWGSGFVLGHNSALAILTAVGFVAAMVGVFHPSIGLFGIGMLCTLDAPTRHFLMTGGWYRWNTLNYWLLLVIGISVPFLWRLSDPHTRVMRLMLVLFALELLVSPDLEAGIQDFLNIVVVLALLVYFAPASRRMDVWYWLAVTCGVSGALGGLVFYLQRDALVWINPNAWSLFPTTALFAICLGFPAASLRSRGQILLSLLAAVNFVWVFLSGSRGNMLIASCCALLLMVAMRGVRRRAIVLTATVVIGMAISTQFTDLQEHALQRIDKLVNPQYNMRAKTSGRADLLLGGWYMFLDHPLGVGTGGFRATWEYLGDRDGLSGFARGWRMASHSAWIKVLAENGVPGGILLTSYVLSFAVVGWRKRHDRDLLFLGLLVTTTLSVAWISTEFQGKGLWFLTAGATTLLHRKKIAPLLRGADEDE